MQAREHGTELNAVNLRVFARSGKGVDMAADGEIVIRTACRADFAEIARIERLSRPAPWPDRIIRQSMDGASCRCAAAQKPAGAGLAGFCFYRYLGTDMEIDDLAVEPAFRRGKIATRLMEYALDCGRGAGIVRCLLDVGATNGAALGLYRKLGFTDDGIRRNYYADGEHAILMSRNVSG